MQTLKIFLIFGLIFSLAACGTFGEEEEEKTTEQEVYAAAQRALDSASWTAAIETLHILEENFPFGKYAEQAQLELIYANYRANEYAAAISAADRFIRLHPRHENVDYAYYMRALASSEVGQNMFNAMMGVDQTKRDTSAARESFNYFAQLLNHFPNSEYAPDARKRMIHQRNLMARHEIHVANYYLKREAYLAAANRGRYVVENFQHTPVVPDALAVMAQAYYFLGLPELAEDSARVLALNYPNHPALNDKGEFNYQFSAQDNERSWWSYLTFGLFDKDRPQEFDTRALYNPSFRDNVEPPRLEG